MKILVLGGTGAMGYYLLPLLSQSGHRVTVTSRSRHFSDDENITYIQGNAHDVKFLKSLLEHSYDVLVDFMLYEMEEFSELIPLFLEKTSQYIFLSSSRVYAGTRSPLTEDSPRLLESTEDLDYKKTNEYALRKARQEDLLKESGKSNWTIVRPYITYSPERLQLGIFEKENWLYRVQKKRTLVLPKELMDKNTSMTWGYDVAYGITCTVGNPDALGEIFHFVTTENMKWKDILEIYDSIIRDKLGYGIKVRYIDRGDNLAKMLSNYYQYKYDRCFDRKFDHSKADRILNIKIDYGVFRECIKKCIDQFLDEKKSFREINWAYEAYVDRLTGEYTELREIDQFYEKMKYLIRRYTPYFRIYRHYREKID